MARFSEVSDQGALATDDSWLFANANAEDEAARNFRRSIFMIDASNVLRPLLISFFDQIGLAGLRRANRKHKHGGNQCR